MSNSYKDTLHMPKTDFAMRGNLGNKEPVMQTEWEKLDLYNKRLKLMMVHPTLTVISTLDML